MSYIDYYYYMSVYKGTKIEPSELCTLIERASDIIDMITGYKILLCGGFDAYLSELEPLFANACENLIKRAVACQVEYIYLGKKTAVTSKTTAEKELDKNKKTTEESDETSVCEKTISKETSFKENLFNMCRTSRADRPGIDNICPDVFSYLCNTNLLCRNVLV